jgi:hypothetical protein
MTSRDERELLIHANKSDQSPCESYGINDIKNVNELLEIYTGSIMVIIVARPQHAEHRKSCYPHYSSEETKF